MRQLQVRENVVGFEKALGAVKVIKDQIHYRSQSLLSLASGYFIIANRMVFCPLYSIPLSTIQFSHKFKSMSVAECDWFHFSCHHLETVSFLSQQSKQSGFGDDLV